MFDPISAGISAGASLLGGLMGKSAADENRAAQERQNERNIALQREFAQSGIQWKVEDARKAGIHPLFALGAPTSSFSNIVGNVGADKSMATAVGAMGQDISRAMLAGSNQDTRNQMMSNTLQELALERGKLTNDLLKARLASTISRNMSAQVPPPIPTEGPFPVPEKSKSEERPPLMFGGRRWSTNPDTSPMKAWEDQYGDEGPVASTLPVLIMYNDFLANYGQPATWPRQILGELWRRTKGEFDFGGNPRVSKPLGRR